MRPAPLQSIESPIHPRPITIDDAVKVFAEKLFGHVGGTTGAAGEKGERRGDKGPDPCFGKAFLGRRFVDVQHWLIGKLLGEFVVRRRYRRSGTVLQKNQPAGASGLIEDHAQELSGTTL